MKNRFTKNILFILVLAFILLLTPLVIAAENDGTVYIKNTSFDPAPGKEFKTTIYVKENSQLAGIDLSLSYNTDILTLVSYDPIGTTTCNAGNGEIMIQYASTKNAVGALSLVELTFCVDENLATGSYDNWITWIGDGVDEVTTFKGMVNGEPQYASLNCSVEFDSLFIRMKGDAYNNNNDGKINSRDAVYILQYAAHMFEMPLSDKIYANVYEDYKTDANGMKIPNVNTRDATKILQYAAKMNVDLDDRINISFYDIDESGNYVLQIVKSVSKGGTLLRVPSVLSHDGYENGTWSTVKATASADAVVPDFSNITDDFSVYAVYDYTGKTAEGTKLFNQVVSAIDNVFMEEGKYISDNFQLPYKNAKSVYNMPSYDDYDVTWKTESGLLAQGLSVVNYIVDVPSLEYTTWVRFTATIIIDKIVYGTVSFDRELKGAIDLPSPEQFEKIVGDVPETIDEDYRLPGYISLESGRKNYGVNIVQNVDIQWSLISGNEKGYDSNNYAFIHLKDKNHVVLKAEFIFDGRVVASYIIERTIPAKTLEGQKEFAYNYLKSFVPTAVSTYYLFPTTIDRYDFSVNWYSTSASGKFDFSKSNIIFENEVCQQIGVGSKAGYKEPGYLVARIERDGEKIEEFTYIVQLIGDSETVDQTRFGDEKLYKALLDIFGVDDGEGGKKLTETSLTGYMDISKYINAQAVSNYRSNNNMLDLSNLELTSIDGIQYVSSVRILNLSGNNFESSDTNGLAYLASLTRLEQLDLSHCGINAIPNNILLNMYNIEGIDISHNNLENLDFLNVDRALNSLTDLFVHDNDLKDISGLLFDNGTDGNGSTVRLSTIPNVRRLTLSRKADSKNSDACIDIYPVSYAKNLVVLWAANLNISDISALSSCKYLETLNLANNEIVALNRTNDGLAPVKKLTGLKKLILDNNKISTVISLNRMVNMEFLSLSGNSISNLSTNLSKLSNLVVLNLNGNELMTFDASYYPNLKCLYLENNELTQISGLDVLAPIAATETTEGKAGLLDLRLNGNTIDADITELEKMSIRQISQLTSLQYLTLSDNNVMRLDFLESLTDLRHLELANANVLQTYEVDDYKDPTTGDTVMKIVDNLSHLYNLTEIRVLDLSKNEMLSDISSLADTSGGLRNIEMLYLDKELGVKCQNENGEDILYEYHPFTDLSSLRWMPKLIALSMQNSGLNDINFVGSLGAIEYLNLSGHSLDTIDFSLFRGKEEIKYLFLDSFVGSNVKNTNLLNNMILLEALSLENTEFSDVGEFPDFEFIRYLNLAHTNINDFIGSDEDFTSINRFKDTLEVLDISGNDRVFTKTNLNHLYDNFHDKETIVYLYEDHSQIGFDSAREALTIQKMITQVPITTAENRRKIHTFFDNSDYADGAFAMQNNVNGYDLAWITVSDWFIISDNILSVYNWNMRDDQTICLSAAFDVYNNDGNVDSIYMDMYVSPSPYTIRKLSYTATSESYDPEIYAEEIGYFNTYIDGLQDATLNNYTFDGWYTELYGGGSAVGKDYRNDKIDPNGNVSDITIFAKWVYDIIFDCDGGQYIDGDLRKVKRYVSNEAVNPVEESKMILRKGYGFTDWYSEELGHAIEEPQCLYNMKLVARWIEDAFTVRYDANGGNGIMNDTAFRFSDSISTLSDNAFTRNGYIFAGWATAPNGSVIYNNVELSSSISSNILPGESITLYAVWEVDPYTIGKNVENGAKISNTQGTKRYVVYNDITRTPQSTEAGYIHIVDWSSYTGTIDYISSVKQSDGTRYGGGNTNHDIAYIDEAYFIGNSSATYTNMIIYHVNYSKWSNIPIVHFKDFNLADSAIRVYIAKGMEDPHKSMIIDVIGNCSVKARAGEDAVTGFETLTFTGSGTLDIYGGDGADATEAGANGADGGIGIIANNIVVDMTGMLNVYGGNGGKGAKGADGGNGSTGSSLTSGGYGGKAGNGGNGTQGSNGGNGGIGGDALTANMTVLQGTVVLEGGTGGSGGAGGAGGTGGTGGYTTRWGVGYGGDGGDGGAPGNGGKGGRGGLPTSKDVTNKNGHCTIIAGKGGPGGTGGKGGNGGVGGESKDQRGIGGNGGFGHCGGSGGDSGAGLILEVDTTGTYSGNIVVVDGKDGTPGKGGAGGAGGAGGKGGDKNGTSYSNEYAKNGSDGLSGGATVIRIGGIVPSPKPNPFGPITIA